MDKNRETFADELSILVHHLSLLLQTLQICLNGIHSPKSFLDSKDLGSSFLNSILINLLLVEDLLYRTLNICNSVFLSLNREVLDSGKSTLLNGKFILEFFHSVVEVLTQLLETVIKLFSILVNLFDSRLHH